MAMTKAEKARLEDAETRAALRWTGPVLRDLLPPCDSGQHIEGWDINIYSRRVYPAWSEFSSHGEGKYEADRNKRHSSQNSCALFGTASRALAALRYGVELEAARLLRDIDVRILGETAGQPERAAE